MFATLETGTFRNSPWHLGQGNSSTILFSEDNLTCTMSRRGAVTLMIAVTKELVSDSVPSSYHCHCDPYTMWRYVHITMLPEPEAFPTRKWRASVSNIGLTLEEDPLLTFSTLTFWEPKKLDWTGVHIMNHIIKTANNKYIKIYIAWIRIDLPTLLCENYFCVSNYNQLAYTFYV